MKKVIYIILFTFCLTHITGCIKEVFDPQNFDPSLNFTPGIALPLGFARLSFEKYLEETSLDEELEISADGFLSIQYSTEIDSGVMSDIFTIDDASVTGSVLNQTGSVLNLATAGMSFNAADSVFLQITSSKPDATIDSITFRSGTISIDITSTSLTGNITISIINLVKNGIPFTSSRSLLNPDLTIQLSDYTLVPGHGTEGNNFLKCILELNIQTPSGPVNPGQTLLSAGINLTGPAYETIYGNFEGYRIDLPAQSVTTSFFSQMSGGHLYFADPSFRLYFENSIGIPFGLYFTTIDAIDDANIHYPLTGPGIPSSTSPKIIRYPGLTQPGVILSDSLVIGRSNSNLPDFISVFPDSVVISGGVMIANPDPPGTTFIKYDSEYKISATIELPLYGKADFLILLDTMTFDYLSSSLPPPEELEKLIVRSSIINSFPVSAQPQIYLLDENQVLLDSLFSWNEVIEGAADTNGDGKADPHKSAPIDIDLPRSKIDALFDTRYIIVKARLSTTDYPDTDVKLYSSYYLDYNVGVIAQLKIKTGK